MLIYTTHCFKKYGGHDEIPLQFYRCFVLSTKASFNSTPYSLINVDGSI